MAHPMVRHRRRQHSTAAAKSSSTVFARKSRSACRIRGETKWDCVNVLAKIAMALKTAIMEPVLLSTERLRCRDACPLITPSQSQ